MARRHFPESECVSIELENDALLVSNRAFLIQSKCKRLAILSFRGTQPLGAIEWLANASVRVDPFRQVGYVHGGFYRSVVALFSQIDILLQALLAGDSIVDVAEQLQCEANGTGATAGGHAEASVQDADCGAPTIDANQGKEASARAAYAKREPVLERLYITGHSLGGALAVLSTALLYIDSRWSSFVEKIGGIYTFGQPMVGDSTFAAGSEHDFGDLLFRHIYDQDIVPHLPPRSTGNFAHFGHQYRSTPFGWSDDATVASQVFTLLFALPLLGADWIVKQVPLLDEAIKRFDALGGRFRLPSLADHSPLGYLRTSLVTRAGAELE